MIIEEFLRNGTLVKHTSDKGVLLEQVETGARYGEAVDIVPCPFTYVETDEPTEPEEDATEADYLNALNEMGVDTDEEG